jgi:hypothetical protein
LLRYLSPSTAGPGVRSTIDLKFLYRSVIAARRARSALQCSSSLSWLWPHSTSEILPREMLVSLANSYWDKPVSSRIDFRFLLKFSNSIFGNLAVATAKQRRCLLCHPKSPPWGTWGSTPMKTMQIKVLVRHCYGEDVGYWWGVQICVIQDVCAWLRFWPGTL